MPETVLVTIEYNGSQQDFSVPLQQPIGMWFGTLVHAVAPEEPCEKMNLVWKDCLLSKTCALMDYSVWDGAALYLKKGA